MDSITYVGLDVHKTTIAVAVAGGARSREVRLLGVFANRGDVVRKMVATEPAVEVLLRSPQPGLGVMDGTSLPFLASRRSMAACIRASVITSAGTPPRKLRAASAFPANWTAGGASCMGQGILVPLAPAPAGMRSACIYGSKDISRQ
jgi:hypothetical protein